MIKALIKSKDVKIWPADAAGTGLADEAVQSLPDLPMIIIGVSFVDDAGAEIHAQEYAFRVEDVPADVPNYFQRQADAMQADIDNATANKPMIEAMAKANSILDSIKLDS